MEINYIHKKLPYEGIVYLTYFLYFSGYYIFLMLNSTLGLATSSRVLTVTLRLVIICGLFIIAAFRKRIKTQYYVFLFSAFALLYIVRVVIEVFYDKPYYMDKYEVLLYFFSFGVFPFLLTGSYKFSLPDYNKMKDAILFSSLIFYILALIFYNSVIGTAGRISNQITDNNESYISPLTLSYCATLGIGIAVSYWMEHKLSISQKVYFIAIIAFSSVPFFLGASRGSLLALFIPFIFVFLIKKNSVSKYYTIVGLLTSIILIVYLSNKFGSDLIGRFLSIDQDIREGNSSASRLLIWKQALSQFVDYPFWGDSLQVKGFDIYPHNLFVEVLLTTGVLGFIPVFLLVIYAFKKTINIIIYAPKFAWICFIFIHSFIINMLSGALYTASWLWLSMGLIFSFDIPGILNRQRHNYLSHV